MPVLAEAGDDVDAVAARVEVAGEQPDLGLLAADDEPGEDEEDADRGRARSSGEDDLQEVGALLRQAAEEVGALVEGDDVGDQVAADRVAVGAEERDGLGGEAAAVPERREAAGDAADLGAADREAVVVEGLAEARWRRGRPGRRRGR